MNFRKEWEELKAEGKKQREEAGNYPIKKSDAANDNGGGKANLAVDSTTLRNAVYALDMRVGANTRKTVRSASDTSRSAARELREWTFGKQISAAQKKWEGKTSRLLRRIATDSHSLKKAADEFDANEAFTEGLFKKQQEPPMLLRNPRL